MKWKHTRIVSVRVCIVFKRGFHLESSTVKAAAFDHGSLFEVAVNKRFYTMGDVLSPTCWLALCPCAWAMKCTCLRNLLEHFFFFRKEDMSDSASYCFTFNHSMAVAFHFTYTVQLLHMDNCRKFHDLHKNEKKIIFMKIINSHLYLSSSKVWTCLM